MNVHYIVHIVGYPDLAVLTYWDAVNVTTALKRSGYTVSIEQKDG